MARTARGSKGVEATQPVEEAQEEIAPPLRASWSGTISLGLVNIPVKAIPLIRDRSIHFRMIHEKCETPISFKKFCEQGDEVPDTEIIFGYELTRGEYVLLKKDEIEAVKPESGKVIRLDSFIDFLEVDPHYFEKTYLLVPDRSDESYSLLREIMKKREKAAIGMVTMFSRERVVLIHYYHNAVVATTMRFEDEVLDPGTAPALARVAAPGEEELKLAGDIVQKLSAPFTLGKYHDHYREQLEELIMAKQKGETIQIAQKKPKGEAKSLMEALRKTAESLG
ncbi:MAG: Ku protein [Methanomicrobiales archaeon]|nr:Ku protein [Methanomicrobiales archaeon]